VLRVFVRLLIVVALATAMLYATIGTTASQTGTGTVDFIATLTLATAKGPEGTKVVVATFDVPAEFQGQTCPTKFASQNNESTHEGNALILTSAGGEIVLENVEDVANSKTEGTGNITLGPKLTVTMVIGPDEESSGGIAVGAFTCQAPCVDPTGNTFPAGSPECEPTCVDSTGNTFPVGSPECEPIVLSPARFTG
jgi:hypothetical protein